MYKNFLLTVWALLPCIFAKTLPENCAEAVRISNHSGVYQIQLGAKNGIVSRPFHVYCELDPNGGDAWTIFQRRVNGDIDFQRFWKDYKNGFGELNTNFWLGLDHIHALTYDSLQELWVQGEDFENVSRWAKYDEFAVGNEDQNYAMIILGKYSNLSNAGDSLATHRGMKFSTSDRKNNDGIRDCGKEYGGWWFRNCYESMLNGKHGIFVLWTGFGGNIYSFKYAHMAIRQKQQTVKTSPNN